MPANEDIVIDGHVHVGTSAFFHMDAGPELLLQFADEAGFDQLFVTHLNALFYDVTAGNDELAEMISKHTDRLVGYCSIPTPRLNRRGLDELRRCREELGFCGLKIYSHPEASIAELNTMPLLEQAAAYRMPVLAHTTPEECDYVMTHVPEVRLVMAHMGGHPYAMGDWHRAVEVAARHRNLYLDTASSQIDNGMLEYAVAQLGAEKILFGTDMPLLDPFTQRAKVDGAEISEQDKAMILGGNLARLLEEV